MFKKIVPTVGMIAKSNIVRHITVQFATTAAMISILHANYTEEGEEPTAEGEIAILIGSMVVGAVLSHAINQAFDNILEKDDEFVYDEWSRKMKELNK